MALQPPKVANIDVDVPIEEFGGLITECTAADIPMGASPFCQDVDYQLGAVFTRAGLTAQLSGLFIGNCNYLKTFTLPNTNDELLLLDSAGNLWFEDTTNAPGALTQITNGTPGNFVNSTTQFGREWLAYSDGVWGSDIPLQWDGTNLDRVSQDGPGLTPTIIDEVAPVFNIVAAPNGTIEVGNLATYTTTVAHGLLPLQTVTVAGVGVAGYNGVGLIINTVPTTTTFTVILATAGLGVSGGGTVTVVGNITAGVHKFVEFFQTREGYLTAPSPIGQWTAAGNLRATVTLLAIGPANIVARWLAFTSTGGGFFFAIPIPVSGSSTGTVVAGNVATTFVVDFSDITLLNSFSIDSAGNDLFNLVVLGPSSGVISYSNRMVWWGERNKIQNFLNMGFDGGFDNATNTVPLGWTLFPGSGGGGSKIGGGSKGFLYQIASAGVPGTSYGQIQQPAYRDGFNVAILQPNTLYSLHAFLGRTGIGAIVGNFIADFFSPTAGVLATATVSINSMTVAQKFFTANFNIATPAIIPIDTVLRIYVQSTSAVGVLSDEIEIFPTNVPFISTTLRVSYNSNPESFDGVTGRIGISNLDGQAIKACFKLRDNLYVLKESSLYVTQDNGSTEPFGWTVSTISNSVGTCSIRGVAVAEEYALFVNQMGVYMFNGSEPVRVNQEIKPVSGAGQGWDKINWRFGSTIWVTLDINNRHLLIGAPVGESNKPNQIFMMNYRELDDSYAMASGKPIHNSYTGKLVSWDMSRKWSMWNISANCCAIVRRQDLSLQVWFGNNTGTGKAYQLDSSNATDDGAAILSAYNTFFFVNREMEQGLQVGSHRHLYTYGAAFTSGVGILSLTAQADSLTSTRSIALAPRVLSSNPNYDIEFGMNFSADRTTIKFATDGVAGSTLFLSKMTMTMKPDPWAPVRGRV